MFICRYLFIEVRQVIVVLKVKLLIRLKNNGRRTEEVLAQISISHKFHKFSGYPLATPEALKHWLLSPEAKSSSRNSQWVQRLPKCSTVGHILYACRRQGWRMRPLFSFAFRLSASWGIPWDALYCFKLMQISNTLRFLLGFVWAFQHVAVDSAELLLFPFYGIFLNIVCFCQAQRFPEKTKPFVAPSGGFSNKHYSSLRKLANKKHGHVASTVLNSGNSTSEQSTNIITKTTASITFFYPLWYTRQREQKPLDSLDALPVYW